MTSVSATENRIAAVTKLSRNEIRQMALWSALADPEQADAFIRDVLPAWTEARTRATQAQTDD